MKIEYLFMDIMNRLGTRHDFAACEEDQKSFADEIDRSRAEFEQIREWMAKRDRVIPEILEKTVDAPGVYVGKNYTLQNLREDLAGLLEDGE